MSYYHVRITLKSNPSHDEIKLDLSVKELTDRILTPYENRTPIVIGGVTIMPNDIKRIKINQTDHSSEVLIPIIKEQRRTKRVITLIPDEWYVAENGKDVTDDFIIYPPGLEPVSCEQANDLNGRISRNVFVVHGRDIKARNAMFEFLRAIGLHPLEWSEAISITGKSTPYIGEVLDVAFSYAQAIVVLMTPDDEACLREQFRQPSDSIYEIQPTPQARPNVIFEAGMAMGREPERTILVEIGKLRPFSDIGGRHVLRIDNSPQKRQELAQRLLNAGCSVNISGTDWYTVGKFEITNTQNADKNDSVSPTTQYEDKFNEIEKILSNINELFIDRNTFSFSNISSKMQMEAGDKSEKVGYILRQMYEREEYYFNTYRDVKERSIELTEAISRITGLLQRNKDSLYEVYNLDVLIPRKLLVDYGMLKQRWANYTLELEKSAKKIYPLFKNESFDIKFSPLPEFEIKK